MNQNIVNIGEFKEELNLDYNVLRELYMEFSKEIIRNKENIDDLISSKNIEELSKPIHNIKGVAANYKAVKLYEVSKKLDSKLKSNEFKDITFYIMALNEVIEESLKEINDYFDESK